MRGSDQLSESDRNRLLRRVDWRFLLPDPHPRLTALIGDGRIGAALALISEGVVHPSPSSGAGCDLAVVVNPDQSALEAAWSSLTPGGVCYTEWYWPTAGGVSGVRRRLHQAGFQDTTCYWAWPWPALARSRFWIPLEAKAARRYFSASRPPVPGRVRRLLHVFARNLVVMASLKVVPFPVCAVAYKPTGDQRSLQALPISVAQRHATELGLLSDQQSCLMLTGGNRTIHKVVSLIFEEPEPHPRAIVKSARVPEAIDLLEKEAAALAAVHTIRPGGVAGVPRVLFAERQPNAYMLGETALEGAPLYTHLNRANARALALQAADWQADLAMNARPQPRSTYWNRLVEPVICEFESTFGAAIDPGLLRKSRSILEGLDRSPLVCEHRDFSPWNVLIAPSRDLAVLDWEGAELKGLPALDLAYFVSHLCFFLDGAYSKRRFRESYRISLDPRTFTGAIRAEVLDYYRDRLGLDRDLVERLGVLVWLVHARSEYRRLLADTTSPVSPDRLRRATFVSLWEEELKRFSPTPQ